MLPRESRLRTAADFAAVVKAGRRAGTRRLVVHALVSNGPAAGRAGFVVSGKVGNSVVRHRVTRRLRPLVRQQLDALGPGVALVIRALPAAAAATSAELDADLRSGLMSAVRKARSAARQCGTAASTGAGPVDEASSRTVGRTTVPVQARKGAAR